MLNHAFRDLSARPRSIGYEEQDEEKEGVERAYLADEPLRAFFVDGVVDLLDHEAAKMNQKRDVSDAKADPADLFSLVGAQASDFSKTYGPILSLVDGRKEPFSNTQKYG